MRRFHGAMLVLTLGSLATVPSALASVHFMQIEQVIGGVNGDTTAQAIQLRMRASLQTLLSTARLRVRDANGANPVTIMDFPTNISNGAAGARILVTTASFDVLTSPTATPDFTMTNPIPASYLAAGSLTFEDTFGTVLWRLSWGGKAYFGSSTGGIMNDADGNFGPPFDGPLPSVGKQALQFQGVASAMSTSNAADYALTASEATFVNNADASFALLGSPVGACCVALRGVCIDDVLETECAALGGRYGGDSSVCTAISPPCEPVVSISLAPVATGLVSPVRVTHAGDGSGRRFIVDQAGFIRIVDSTDTLLPTPFLDLTATMVTINPGFDERGLLGLAFHPNYASNGRFFVRYSAPRAGDASEPCFGTSRGCHAARVSEFSVSANPDIADAGSEIVLFSVDEPEFNHNAGGVAFGTDGLLYFTLGDGGGRDDGLSNASLPHGPIGHAQNIDTPLGSVIRIDVDSPPAPGLAYAIPADNPFVGGPGLDEIYAYGFRNPFSFAFDDGPGGDGALHLADVGQELFEELDVVVKGGNYGWPIREGAHCFNPADPNLPPDVCASVGTVLGDPLLEPVSEYLQPVPCGSDADCAALGVVCGSNGLCADEGGISAILGGVYRGAKVPPMRGKLVYGDFSNSFGVPGGRLYYFDLAGSEAFQRRQFFLAPDGAPLGEFVKGFGVDEDGEFYVCTSTALAPTGTTGVVSRITQPLPTVVGVSPRHLEVTLPDGSDPVGIVVSCPGGISKHVGAPTGIDDIAQLVDSPASAVFLTPAQWGGVVHIKGVDVTPDKTYDVQLNFGTVAVPDLSAAVSATTSIWADVAGLFSDGAWNPPDNEVDILDILAILATFAVKPGSPAVWRTDLIGVDANGITCTPDGTIDILDVLMSLDGFRGNDYVFTTGCPELCP